MNGDFIVPFGVFFLLWPVSAGILGSLFYWLNSIITRRVKKSLNRLFNKISGQSVDTDDRIRIEELDKLPNWLKEMSKSIKKTLSDNKEETIHILDKAQIDLTSDFVLLVRSIAAIIIFYTQVSYFDWFLFIALMIIQIIMIVKIIVVYQLSVLYILYMQH